MVSTTNDICVQRLCGCCCPLHLTPCSTPLLPAAPADHPALLPTYAARGFFFSGLLELARLPAMADLARAAMSAFFGGDASQWERALVMPHYSAAGMPACSLHQVCTSGDLGNIVHVAWGWLGGGRGGQWERALVMPHYSAAGMPEGSLHQVCACVVRFHGLVVHVA
jgi:hypothetical protein